MGALNIISNIIEWKNSYSDNRKLLDINIF